MAANKLVFQRGQRSLDFFLVLHGNIEIFDTEENRNPNIFTVHRELRPAHTAITALLVLDKLNLVARDSLFRRDQMMSHRKSLFPPCVKAACEHLNILDAVLL